jgi:hypothetical protein
MCGLVTQRICGETSAMGEHNMKMTEQQRLEYKIYRAACREANVKPVRADFLYGEIPYRVIEIMGLEQNEREHERRKVLAGAAVFFMGNL